MLQGWLVVAVALGYIGFLFVVASYGDRARQIGRSRLLIYPLSLAIYCTSWTFFGSVGLASRTGYDFLTIYVGPILMIGLGAPLIMRIVRLAKAQNITDGYVRPVVYRGSEMMTVSAQQTKIYVAIAVATFDTSRNCTVRLPASSLTLSVRSFHVPATPFTFAWPPSLPSVPTSRATRVTSPAKALSWSTMVLMVFFSSRISPRTSTVMFLVCSCLSRTMRRGTVVPGRVLITACTRSSELRIGLPL